MCAGEHRIQLAVLSRATRESPTTRLRVSTRLLNVKEGAPSMPGGRARKGLRSRAAPLMNQRLYGAGSSVEPSVPKRIKRDEAGCLSKRYGPLCEVDPKRAAHTLHRLQHKFCSNVYIWLVTMTIAVPLTMSPAVAQSSSRQASSGPARPSRV